MSTAQAQQIRAPPHARNVAQFLRSSKSGMKIRVGALNGKRVDYFKGVPNLFLAFVSYHFDRQTARQICHQSAPLASLRQAQKRPGRDQRGRGRSSSHVHHSSRLLPTCRARKSSRLIDILSAPRHRHSATVVRARRLLCMVLRGIPVDDVRRRSAHGGHHARRSHVPSVATHHASWGVVYQRGVAWPHRCLLWTGDRKTDILRDLHRRRAPRYLDVPKTLCRRRRGEHRLTCHVIRID